MEEAFHAGIRDWWQLNLEGGGGLHRVTWYFDCGGSHEGVERRGGSQVTMVAKS